MSLVFNMVVGGGGGTGIPLIVTCASAFAGATITCSDGTTTLTETCPSVSPYEVSFSLPNNGTWTVSGTVSGVTYSESIVTSDAEVELSDGVDIIVDVYSAVNDTISYTGLDHQTHTITTNSNGYASATIRTSGSGSAITFTSSVAKDPSNLVNAYTKTITLTRETTSVKVMPDGAVYWYGYMLFSFTAKAIYYLSNFTRKAPTITTNTNNVTVRISRGDSSSNVAGTWVSNNTLNVSNYTSMHMVAHNYVGSNGDGTEGPRLSLSTTNTDNYSRDASVGTGNGAIPTSSTPAKVSTDIALNASEYVGISIYSSKAGTANYSAITVDSIWFE